MNFLSIRKDVEYYIHNNKPEAVKNIDISILEKNKQPYEVIKVTNGKAIFPKEHIERLNNSLSTINIKALDVKEILNSIILLTDINNVKEGNIKILIDIHSSQKSKFLYFIKHKYPTEENIINGVKTITQKAQRNNPVAKFSDLSIRGKANKLIENKNIFETILINNNNEITEGSRSNIFFIKGKSLYTSADSFVLNGITRSKVIEIANNNNIKIIFRNISLGEINKFESCFLSGTSPGVLQVNSLDKTKFKLNSDIYNIIFKEYKKLLDNLSN